MEKIFRGNVTVDLKKTQIELLKILQRLKVPETDRTKIIHTYELIFKDLEPIVKLLKTLKVNSFINLDDHLLRYADPITKFINYVGDESIDINLKPMNKVKPILKIKDINFEDGNVIDSGIVDKANNLITKNNSNKLDINFNDKFDNSLIDIGNKKIDLNNENKLSINLRDDIFDNSMIDKGTQILDQSTSNKLTIKLPDLNILDEKLAKNTNQQLTNDSSNSIDINFKDEELVSDTIDTTSIFDIKPIKINLKDTDLGETDIDKYESENAKLYSYIKNHDTFKIGNIAKLKKILEELDDTIKIIESLIKKLRDPLNDSYIINTTEKYAVIELGISVNLKNSTEIDSSDIDSIEKKTNLFNLDTIKLKDKSFINEINLTLDRDTEINQAGGNIEDYLNVLKNKSPKYYENRFPNAMKRLQQVLNEFNILFIQFTYYKNFMFDKINDIKKEESFEIVYQMDYLQIKQVLENLNKHYSIINEPNELFDSDINLNKKGKRIYFKHYYQIFILRHFLIGIKNKMENMIKEDKDIDEVKLSVYFYNEDDLITDETPEDKKNYIKYYTLFQLYSDLLEVELK